MRLKMMITLLALTLAACSAPFEGNALTGPLPDAAAPSEASPTGDAPSSVSPPDAPNSVSPDADGAASPDATRPDGQGADDAVASDTGTDGGTPTVEVLASNQVAPSGLAVGDAVFWTTEGAHPDYVGNVFALSLSDPTATPTVIAASQKHPRALTFTDGALYWGGDDAIGKWTATHGATNLGVARLYNVVADSAHIYFAMEVEHPGGMPPSGAVARCPLDGCRGTPEILATSDATIVGIAIDGGALFWAVFSSSNGAIYRLTLDGASSPRAIAVDQVSPTNVAAFDGFVYWVNPASGTVSRVSADVVGATPTILANNQPSPSGIAVDDRAVYWTTNTRTGQVMKLAHGTSTPIVLASGQPNPGHVRVDADYAYWTTKGDGSGSIRRAPK
jgi:hypothetical protein